MQSNPPLRPVFARVALGAALLSGLIAAGAAQAQSPPMSAADQAFVAKVSQGGMFEVVASQLAEQKAMAQDVKDLANTEVHDHQLVGDKLKSIASSLGIDLPGQLNADFQKRVDALNALSGQAFDSAYLKEMDRIHALDGAAFAKEAKAGQNPDLKAFAAETVRIVKRHIGALHGI